MPNHIINIIRLTGDREKINELLESVKDNRFGIGSLDFNKVIPMPESLQIETSSSMERGLKAYKEFVDICTFDGANKDMDLLNIPEDKEKIFLRMRKDVKREEWELGRQAFRNEVMYGAPSWYDWSIKNWGTKWNSYGYDNLDRSATLENPAFSFYTAWSAPHPIIEKLAESYPEVSFEHEWADEDIGMNCGRKTYEHGECTDTSAPISVRCTIIPPSAAASPETNPIGYTARTMSIASALSEASHCRTIRNMPAPPMQTTEISISG